MIQVCTFWAVVLLFLCLWACTVLVWTRQAGRFSGSSSVHFIWKVSWKELYRGIAVETEEVWGSEFGAKLRCWPGEIPMEWVVNFMSHSHHLWMVVQALPSTVLLVIRQGINTAMSGESDTSLLQLEFRTEILAPFAVASGRCGEPDYKQQMWQHLACGHQEWTLPFFPPLEQQKTGSIELSELWLDLSGLQPTSSTFISSVAYLDSHTVKVDASRSQASRRGRLSLKDGAWNGKGREFI